MYEVVPVSRRDLVVSAVATGQLEPVLTVEVKSKASGEIIDMRVQTGAQVQPGQLLASIDPRQPRNLVAQAEANLEVARAQLENARAQLRRAQRMFELEGIPETEFETAKLAEANAKAAVVRAEIDIETAADQVEDTQVRAPLHGTVLQKNVELGTVISSPTRDVGGGTVLFTMANLDTMQVRSLVDETDIGKVRAGLDASITVDAFPNRPFKGKVLKIEPLATVQQNVTMFPVLIAISNPQHLLMPGMNCEVEIHVGDRQGVLAIPNAALRTPRDVTSAAQVLGLDPEWVQQTLAAADAAGGKASDTAAAGNTRSDGTNGGNHNNDATTPDSAGVRHASERESPSTPPNAGSSGTETARASDGKPETLRLPDGREVALPAGTSAEVVRAAMQKRMSGQELSSAERALLGQVFGGMRRGGGGGRSDRREDGGSYIVFAMRSGKPTPLRIRTGLTDLDYIEVTAGLAEQDTVLVLPSASLVQSQRDFRERFQRMTGGGLPGVQQQTPPQRSGGAGRG